MALSSTIVWEVRTTGSDNNGGGFKTGASGTDYSQQNAAQYALTGIASAGTGNTVLSASAAAAMVGNVAQVISGTNFTTGFFEVTSVSVGVSITFSTNNAGASICTGVGASGVINIGGALASPGKLGGATAAGNTAWFKSGTYTITSATENVSGGVLKDVVGGVDVTTYLHWEGYQTTRGDRSSTRPVFTLQNSLTSSAIWIIDYEGASKKFTVLDSIDVDAGTGNTNANGIRLTTNEQILQRSKVSNTTAIGIDMTDQYEFVSDVEVTGFSGTAGVRAHVSADASSVLMRAAIHDGSAPGFDGFQGPITIIDALVYDITNGGTGTVAGTGMIIDYNAKLTNVTVDNSAASNIYIVNRGAPTPRVFTNVVSYGAGAYGWTTEATESAASVLLINCAGGGNASGNTDSGLSAANKTNFVTLTADPFVDRANDNYALNTTAGGGAALRAAGVPGALGGTTTGYRDIGAVQHADPAGGSGGGLRPVGVGGLVG